MPARIFLTSQLIGTFCIALSLLAVPAFAQTGVLNMGVPESTGDTVRVPVQLEGEVGNGVSAMDFRLTYDPLIFEPVSAAAGSALQSTGKLVEANVSRPGEYTVLIFGMNQTGVSGGEVANIELRVLGEPPAGATELAITNTTLSLSNAQRLPSRGSTRTVRFDGPPPAEPTEPGPPQVPLAGGGGQAPAEDSDASGIEFVGSGSPDVGSERPGQPLEVAAKLVDQLREAEALRSGLPPGGRGAAGSVEGDEADAGAGAEAADVVSETTQPLASTEAAVRTEATPDDLTVRRETPVGDGAEAPIDRSDGGRTKKNVAVGLAVMVLALLGGLWGVRTVLVR